MRVFVLLVATFALLAGSVQAAPDTFSDPLEVPAAITRLATSTQLAAVTHAGKSLVAVGVRGLIIRSDNDGTSWTQSEAPVSSDLLAVHFPTASDGWAVGHDGVVLHSKDGGRSWVKQLDGRQAAVILTTHFSRLAETGDAEAKRLLQDIQLNYESGPEQALLDVWFEDALHGFVCGSFGTLLATRDGGKTWESRIEHVDYGSLLHFNAMRGIGKELYIASEKGIVFRLDRAKDRFVPIQTGYNGSFFSLAGQGNMVIAVGLRGTAYRSTDAGNSWQSLNTGLMGAVTGADNSVAGSILLVSQNSDLLVSRDNGSSFRAVRVPRPSLLSGVLQASEGLAVVVGLNGVQQVNLK